jgi:hypothetical protein
MVIELLFVYFGVALVSSVACLFIRGQFSWQILVSDLILGSAAAWAGAFLLSTGGPVVYGVPVMACFALALPMLFVFNLVFGPAREPATEETAEVITFPVHRTAQPTKAA